MISGLRVGGRKAARVGTTVAVSRWGKGEEGTITVVPPPLCVLCVPLRILEPGLMLFFRIVG